MSDFVEVFGDWLVNGTQVAKLKSDVGIEGRSYESPVTADGLMIEYKRRLVRAADGREVISERTLFVPNGHPQRALFTLGSQIIFADGVKATAAVLQDFAPYGVVDHLVVTCE